MMDPAGAKIHENPVSISNTTTPNDQISTRLSAGLDINS
jgi:hypothetical protein